MPDTSIDLGDVARDWRASAPVWVLDDPRDRSSVQAIGIAERLGLPFRRVPLRWSWLAPLAALAPRGSLVGVAATGQDGDPVAPGMAGRGREQHLPLPAVPRCRPGADAVRRDARGVRCALAAIAVRHQDGALHAAGSARMAVRPAG